MIKKIFEYYVEKDGVKQFTARNFLSKQDENIISEVNQLLNEYYQNKTVFLMMKENFNDLFLYLTCTIKKENQEEITISNDANRLMINYLAMAKLYIDSMEESIKKYFTEYSPEFEEFKLLVSKKYDEKFSYRFLYNLRNYTQHYGFPIHSIKYFFDNEGRENVRSFISTKQLIEGNYHWKPIILEDLKKKIDIDVLEIVSEHIISMEIIYQYILSCHAVKLVKEVEKYLRFIRENNYVQALYYIEFESYKEYLKRKKENYGNIHPLIDKNRVRECLDDLRNYGLIKIENNSIKVYSLKKVQ